MTRAQFLAASPRELAMLFDEELHSRLEPAALICCLLSNIHRDPEKRSRPFTVADFLPGEHPASEDGLDEEMKAFIDALNRGETIEQSPGAIEAFQASFSAYMKPAADCGKTTLIGPSGKMERA